MSKFATKVIVAICGSLSFVLIFIFLPVWVTTILATFISVMIFYEFAFGAKLVTELPLRIMGFAVSALIPWMIYFNLKAYWIFSLVFLTVISAFVIYMVKKDSLPFDSILRFIFCESFFQVSISLMTPLLRAESGVSIIIMAFIASWGTDAIAQLTGRKFGKTYFVPNISPNKSLEGSISGLIGSTIIIAVYAVVLQCIHYTVPIAALIISGFLAGIAGEIGDLFFSNIKRGAGIKDFGNLIKGHGGVLDRFDSVLFVLPVWYVFAENFVITK